MREATVAAVDPSYFEALNAPMLAGRAFTTADAVPGTRVAIVDQGFVDQILRAAMRSASRCGSATLRRPYGAGDRGTLTIPRDRVTGTR